MNIFYFEIVLPQFSAAYVKRPHQKQNYTKLHLEVSSTLNKKTLETSKAWVDAPDDKWSGNASLCWAWYNSISAYFLKLLHKCIFPYQCCLSSSGYWKSWFKTERAERDPTYFSHGLPMSFTPQKNKKTTNTTTCTTLSHLVLMSLVCLSQFKDLGFLIIKTTKHWGFLEQNLWALSGT